MTLKIYLFIFFQWASRTLQGSSPCPCEARRQARLGLPHREAGCARYGMLSQPTMGRRKNNPPTTPPNPSTGRARHGRPAACLQWADTSATSVLSHDQHYFFPHLNSLMAYKQSISLFSHLLTSKLKLYSLSFSIIRSVTFLPYRVSSSNNQGYQKDQLFNRRLLQKAARRLPTSSLQKLNCMCILVSLTNSSWSYEKGTRFSFQFCRFIADDLGYFTLSI